jgi:general secretion pathway protein G
MKTALSSQPQAGRADVETNFRPRSGFTMVELLTVITIIMILAALVLGAAAFVSRKADEGRCQARMQFIKNALEDYKLDYGKYPPQPNTRSGYVPFSVLFTVPLASGRPSGEKKPYLTETNFLNSSAQLVDPWGKPFLYEAPGQYNTATYDLWSCGPNGADDSTSTTSDDINNWSSGH